MDFNMCFNYGIMWGIDTFDDIMNVFVIVSWNSWMLRMSKYILRVCSVLYVNINYKNINYMFDSPGVVLHAND